MQWNQAQGASTPPFGHEDFWRHILAPRSFAYLDIIGQLPFIPSTHVLTGPAVAGGEPTFRALVSSDVLSITVSTSAPSGTPNNGDQWIQYT